MKLTTKMLDGFNEPGKVIYDGSTTGLCLRSTGRGKGAWSYRYALNGKRREKSLGSYPGVTLPIARERAQELGRQVRAGIDPVAAARDAKQAARDAAQAVTFEQAARALHQELAPGWKNAKHAGQWINTLTVYVFPLLGSKPLGAITPKDCADALRPIWLDKPETAARTRQRLHAVMQWAWAHGHIAANPVAVVDHLLPKQNARREHQPAMPWRDVPAFCAENLAQVDTADITRAALLFTILTAARSGEVRGATWGEFDLDAGVWTVPAERMKAKLPHRVPLAAPMLELLSTLKARKLHDTLVFPSPRGGKVLSDMVLTAFLRRVGAQSDTAGRVATAHGFRSSFRDWCSEQGYPRDLAERALAHIVANKVEAAYHRTDLLEQRRAMMQAWARHVLAAETDAGNVLPFAAVS
jgi:integrase